MWVWVTRFVYEPFGAFSVVDSVASAFMDFEVVEVSAGVFHAVVCKHLVFYDCIWVSVEAGVFFSDVCSEW